MNPYILRGVSSAGGLCRLGDSSTPGAGAYFQLYSSADSDPPSRSIDPDICLLSWLHNDKAHQATSVVDACLTTSFKLLLPLFTLLSGGEKLMVAPT